MLEHKRLLWSDPNAEGSRGGVQKLLAMNRLRQSLRVISLRHVSYEKGQILD